MNKSHVKKGMGSMKKTVINASARLLIGFLILFFIPVVSATEESDYHHFYQEQSALLYQGDEIVVSLESAIYVENQESVTISVVVEEEGMYYPFFTYLIESESVLPTKMHLQVNDSLQFKELNNVIFRSNWQRSSETVTDRYGNEIVGEITKLTEVIHSYLYDSTGLYDRPLAIYLKKGENKLHFTSLEGELTISELRLHSEKSLNILNIEKDQVGEVVGTNEVSAQGEFPVEQNASSIRPGAIFDSSVTPYDPKKRVLNILDSASFYSNGDSVSYELVIPEDGYYYLSLHYRQDSRIDFPVFLNIYIDGKIPSESFFRQPMPYTTKFAHKTISNKEEQMIPIYLESGARQVTFEISGEPSAAIFRGVTTIISEIQELSLQITDLLGGTVDRNRDVNIEEYLPGTKDQLVNWANELAELGEYATDLAGGNRLPGAYSQLAIAERQLLELEKDYRYFANRYDELTSIVTANLSTLLQESVRTGLSIDEITFHQEALGKQRNSVILAIRNFFTRFFHSFTNDDYEVRRDSANLQVWVNRPRQYVEVLQQMIDQQFTPTTGIQVDISIMPDENKLILANASGTSPDVALSVNSSLPFDMGIRNALVDLSAMDDFDLLMESFPDNIATPYTIGDSVYALPETMNFYVMFYRRDILDALGLAVPDTLEELVNMLPALSQQGMSAFYPTAINGYKGFPVTMPIVYQYGGSFYTDDIRRTGINQEQTIQSLRYLTDLFTIYNLPKEVPSFYQQFRDGSIPIGVSDYNTYNMILNAAPEISNLWDIALIPGIPDEEGTVRRYSSGAAETSVVFKSIDRKEDSWEFLQWWHSAETQVAFGIELQTTNGKEYIWNTANIEAFEQLPFITKHKQVILEQTKWNAEVPRSVSSYMIEREVNAIYNGVVIDGKNLRRLTDRSAKIIDRETMRKLEEFGFYSNNEMQKPYPSIAEVTHDAED